MRPAIPALKRGDIFAFRTPNKRLLFYRFSPRYIEGGLPATLYDQIGRTYSGRRETDPRIAAAITLALDGCASILNVGAGSGSYEPASKSVIALEPSRTMIAQRPRGAAPVVQSVAEYLPFRDRSFDAVLGVLTVHHWKDKESGLSECRRVARSLVVFLTIDFDVCARFWLFDYSPELIVDRYIFPNIGRYSDSLGPVELIPIPIPADCRDGFLGAYWKRPRAYLDPGLGSMAKQRIRRGASNYWRPQWFETRWQRLGLLRSSLRDLRRS
jgi:SAM-dependent methyltransferase